MRSEDVGPAIERALHAGRPAVVHVVVDDRENTNPPGLDDFTAMCEADNI